VADMSKVSQSGGVSIFIVIFSSIIITIITVGFTQFVIRNQQQSIQNDLSDRAYDSALAGVEDAKRVLVAYTNACSANLPQCSQLKTVIDSQTCDTIAKAGIAGSTVDTNTETTIGTTDDNQAYTCVKILMQTNDYQGSLAANESSVVHIKGVSPYTKIRLTWFSKKDGGDVPNVSVYQPTVPLTLPSAATWPLQAPPIMRAQFIPADAKLSDLDTQAKTAFLYPIKSPGVDLTYKLSSDSRPVNGSAPQPSLCSVTFTAIGGACKKTLEVPSTTDAYLQLQALYNKTSFTIELLDDSGNIVKLDGVAPSVDATGRAGDVFRRVDARVKLGGVSLQSPFMATQGSLCKPFTLEDPANGNSYTAQPCVP